MSVVITLKVVPQSGRQKLVWDEKAGILKMFLKSAPEKNKANDELVFFLSKILGMTRGSVVIVSGHTGRRKRVRVETEQTEAHLLAQCGVVGVQQTVGEVR